jgi:hypothetical protein
VVPVRQALPDNEGNMTDPIKHWRDETRWQPLSEAVDVLKRRVEALYHACQDDQASDAHDDLTACEWRLRQAERGK